MTTTLPPRPGAADDYNLAKRVYAPAPRHVAAKPGRRPGFAPASIAETEAPTTEYNLAARVYGVRPLAVAPPIEAGDLVMAPPAATAAAPPLTATPGAPAPHRGTLARLGGLRTF